MSTSAALAGRLGRILVADTNNNRVQLCDYEGVCTAFGHLGPGKGQFFRPGGVDVDAQGKIVVSDTGNHRVLVFDAELKPIELNLGANGAWFNPDTSGQGIFLDVLEAAEQVFLGWFTYETDAQPADAEAVIGHPGHRWMTAQGDLDEGRSPLYLYRPSGGLFDIPQTVTNELVGEAYFELTSCWTALSEIGDPGNRWITAQGAFENNKATLDAYLSYGGLFDDPAEVITKAFGTIELEFFSCSSGHVHYDFPETGLAGDIPIERVSNANVEECELFLE